MNRVEAQKFLESIFNELSHAQREHDYHNRERGEKGDFAVLFSIQGREKLREALALTYFALVKSPTARFFIGDSKFCNCPIYENCELVQDFLIIKQI